MLLLGIAGFDCRRIGQSVAVSTFSGRELQPPGLVIGLAHRNCVKSGVFRPVALQRDFRTGLILMGEILMGETGDRDAPYDLDLLRVQHNGG
jgi:hypothetical protein